MISRLNLFYIGLRSLFVQVLWNFERMQNVGFTFTIQPILKKLYPNIEDYRASLKRHLVFFNIHPYMASILSGLVILYEEKMSLEKKDYTDQISSLKNTMSGPLSAIGDSFIWGLWRPLVAVLIISSFYIFFSNIEDNKYYFFLILIYLFVYNVPHIFLRFFGIFKAYNEGTKVIIYVKKFHDLNLYRLFRIFGTIFIFAGFMGFVMVRSYTFITIIKIMAIAIIFISLNRRKLSSVKILFFVLFMLLIFSYIRVI
jgi:mannose/fructose/N-acetylgalactosamine-specific phosphotransferase system component IID